MTLAESLYSCQSCTKHEISTSIEKKMLKCAMNVICLIVIVALESCMICGVLSSGCVRSARGIVALLIIPHGDNWFILHLSKSLSITTFAATVFEYGKRFVHHVVVRHGNATPVRDVV